MRKLKVWASKVLAGVMAVACFVGTTPLYSRAAADETAATISATDSTVCVVRRQYNNRRQYLCQ